MADGSTLLKPESWPHRPCLLRMPPESTFQRRTDNGSKETLPMNRAGVFSFESDLFIGVAWVRIAGTHDVGVDYFGTRRRRMEAVIQGQFKQEISFADVLTGQAFEKPLKNLPPKYLLEAVVAIVKRLSPGVQGDFTAARPYGLNILAATAQAMCVSEVGSAPDIMADIQEDTRLLGGHFSKEEKLLSSQERKRYFSSRQHASKYVYRTDLVYTFDFYQDRLDMAQNSFDCGFIKFDLSKYLNGQPVQIMAQTQKGQWLYLFEVWHERNSFVEKFGS